MEALYCSQDYYDKIIPDYQSIVETDEKEIYQMLCDSYYENRSGQIVAVLKPGYIFVENEKGTTHGSPWSYDRHIPFIITGKGVKKGNEDSHVTLQDIAPTISYLADAPLPDSSQGRILYEAFEKKENPALIAVIVLDQFRDSYFEEYKNEMKNIKQIASEGLRYTHAMVDHLPTATAVSHTSIGTGAKPSVHGIVGNNFYDIEKKQIVYAMEGSNPKYIEAYSLADVYLKATDHRVNIFSVGGADRTAIGMGGHGAAFDGKKSFVYWYDETSGKYVTNDKLYKIPEILEDENIEDYGKLYGYDCSDPEEAKSTPALSDMIGTGVVKLIENKYVGISDFTDIIYVNFKSADFAGHKYGPGPELREAIKNIDRNVGNIKKALDSYFEDDYVMIITADHGAAYIPEETGKGGRVKPSVFMEKLKTRFGDSFIAGEPAGGIIHLYFDEDKLSSYGVTLEDIANWLKQDNRVFNAYTRDELLKL